MFTCSTDDSYDYYQIFTYCNAFVFLIICTSLHLFPDFKPTQSRVFALYRFNVFTPKHTILCIF